MLATALRFDEKRLGIRREPGQVIMPIMGKDFISNWTVWISDRCSTGCDVGNNRGRILRFTCVTNISLMIRSYAKNAVTPMKRKRSQTCISGSLRQLKIRSPNNVVNRTAFDPADVRAVELRFFRQSFLRQPGRVTAAANV